MASEFRALEFRGFTAKMTKRLISALREVKKKVQTAQLPPDLASGMSLRLGKSGDGAYVGITYRGDDAKCGEGRPRTEAYGLGHHNIFLCAKAFTATYRRKPRLPAILLHELVHTCGGNEVDAETYENYLFADEGATLPDKEDLNQRFKEVDFKGEWVEMNRRTGEVTMRDTGRLLITFPKRSRREK